MRESTVEQHLKFRVEETGGIIRKACWIARKGCPDRFVGWPSTQRSGFVELKGSRGRLSIHQEREITLLRRCGVRVDVLASIEEVDAFVQEMSGE